eukprot:83460-Pyramimonas_sp.AAC.2
MRLALSPPSALVALTSGWAGGGPRHAMDRRPNILRGSAARHLTGRGHRHPRRERRCECSREGAARH